jgi:hypothetical protein
MSYSPKIKKDLIKKLYHLKQSSSDKPPMTRMVNEAVEDYLNKKGVAHSVANDTKLFTSTFK